MKSITQALKLYKIDNSVYPSTQEGLKHLVVKKYFEENRLPKDPWGSDFIYTLDDELYEIISLGIDKKESDNDIYYSKCNK